MENQKNTLSENNLGVEGCYFATFYSRRGGNSLKYVFAFACIYVCMYMRVYICIHTRTRIYIHPYTVYGNSERINLKLISIVTCREERRNLEMQKRLKGDFFLLHLKKLLSHVTKSLSSKRCLLHGYSNTAKDSMIRYFNTTILNKIIN